MVSLLATKATELGPSESATKLDPRSAVACLVRRICNPAKIHQTIIANLGLIDLLLVFGRVLAAPLLIHP
jgi:hypothetical protein